MLAKAPKVCRHCNHSVRLVENKVIYGRNYGNWPWIYWCSNCGASVGVHPGTKVPLGSLANNRQREARKVSKAIFIKLYKRKLVSRNQAYRLLAQEMGIKKERCHFGWFDEADCARALVASYSLLSRLTDSSADISHRDS